MNDRDELLNIKQAAEFLKVSETSLRRWTNSGRLACLRVGRKRERRFRRADLLAFLEEQPKEPGPHPGPAESLAAPQSERSDEALADRAHLCGLYATDDGRAMQAAAFLAEGLRSGSTCFVMATPSVRADILAHLARSHRDLRAAVAERLMEITEYAGSSRAQIQEFEARYRAALDAGARSLRMVADVWVVAEWLTRKELIDYEARYETMSQRYPIVTLCLYDVRRFGGMDMVAALRGHADMFRFPTDILLPGFDRGSSERRG
jgi:excisionase family DNA binding protein